MEPSTNNHPHPLADSPHFVRVTRAQWKAEQAERYKFAFVARERETGHQRDRQDPSLADRRQTVGLCDRF